MKYSAAFNELYEMSLEMDIQGSAMYERVAVFLGRMMLNRPQDMKDRMLLILSRLTDKEWEMVSLIMVEYIKGYPVHWHKARREWVRALDTYRVFERI